MKTTLAVIALLCAAGAARAADAKLGQGSKLWIEGKSTLHAWKSSATSLDAAASAEGPSFREAVSEQAPVKLTVTVPVAALKSEHSGLDKNLRKALGSDRNPDIVFTMSGYTLDQKAGTVTAEGRLSVAGAARPETITAKLANKDGRLVLDGEQPLLMTDFGVRPPTVMMGAIKADDRVVVKFHVELEPADDAPKNGK